jgi:autotransporter-associated beta strand protein
MNFRPILGAVVLLVAGAKSGFAQTTTWTPASGVWSVSGNWVGGVPVAADTVIFDSNATSTVDAAYVFTNLEFTGGTLVLNSSSGSLSASNGIFYSGGPSVTINVPIIGSGNLWLNGGTGTVTLNPGANANTYSGSTEVFAGATLTDGGANSYSPNSVMYVGGTGGGTLMVNYSEYIAGLNDGGANGSVLIAGGATLDLVGGYTGTFSGVISGAGNLEKDVTGTLTLLGANTYTGTTVINGAGGTAIEIGNGGTTGSIASSSVSGTGTLEFDLSSNYTYAGTLSGALQVAQQGTGTTTLSGTNTYTGATTINSGTLQAGSTSAFGNSTQTLLINGSGTLDLNGFSNAINAVQSLSTTSTIALNGAATLTLSDIGANSSTTFAGAISGTGSLNTHEYQLSITGNSNTYSGGTTITSGTLIANNTNPLDSATGTGPITIAPGGALLLGQANTNGYINSGSAITDNGTLQFFRTDVSANVISNNISGSGQIEQSGSGITELSGTNTYSGVTTVFNGTLEAGSTSAFGGASGKSQIDFTYQGTLALNGFNNTVGSINGTATAGGVNLGSKTLTINDTSSNTDFAAVISGVGGSLVFGGQSMILTGSNTYTGSTDITTGLILVANPTGYGLGTGPITIGAPGTLQIGANSTAGAVDPTSSITDNGVLAFSLTNSVSFPNTVSGTGGVNFLAAGSITFPTANTYSGNTQIEAGTLIADNPTGSATGTGNIFISPGATLVIGNADTSGSVAAAAITNSGTVEFYRTDIPTFSSAISGSGNITVSGSGTGGVTLSGANSYTGTTLASHATVNAGSSTALGNGSDVTLITSTLNLNGNNLSVGSLASDSASTVLLGANTLTLTDALSSNFGGAMTGTGGSLVLNGSGEFAILGSVTYTGGTTIGPSGYLSLGLNSMPGASMVGPVLDNGQFQFAPYSTDNYLFSGSITGTGLVRIVGAGIVTLENPGGTTYSGITDLVTSTLTDGAANAFSPNSDIYISSGGSLVVTRNETVGGLFNGSGSGPVSIATGMNLTSLGNGYINDFLGVISGGGSFTVSGGVQGLGGNNTFSGGVTVTNGAELFVSSNTAVGTGTLTFGPGADEMSPDGMDITLSNPITFASGGGIDNDDGGTFNLTLTGQISGVIGDTGIVWCTPGTLTLTGDNSFYGGVDMREGILLLGNDNAAGYGTITLDTGTIMAAYGGPGVTRTLANDISLNGGSAQFGNGDNNNLVLNGTISAETSVNYVGGPSGTLTLNADNSSSFFGPFTISSGTVIAGNNNAFGTTENTVYLAGNSNAGLNVMTGVTINNPIVTSGTANVISGSGTIGSSLTVDSTVVLSPSASPGGGPGNLTFTNPLTLTTGGTINFSIYDANGAAGTGYSLITANGGAIFSASPGTIGFNLFSVNSSGGSAAALNFNPSNSYSWTVINANGGSLSGFTANQFNLNTSGFTNGTGGGSFTFTQVGNSLDLNFTPVPEPSTWILMGAGILTLGFVAIRYRRPSRA